MFRKVKHSMNREIGSEFWTGCVPLESREYSMRPLNIYGANSYRLIETLSGRTALEYIVEILLKKGLRSVCLPSYCCHTMIEPFLTHGMGVRFYDIRITRHGISRTIECEDYDAILLMDYFGHTDNETIDLANKERLKGKTIIYDATHSMYSDISVKPYDFVYGSYRKWVDINCGFLAWKEEMSAEAISQDEDNELYASIRQELFDKKALYMRGSSIDKDDFLPLIEQAEVILERQYHHKKPDGRSGEVLRTTSATYIKARRKENARLLTDAINKMNDVRVRCLTPVLNPSDVPLFVPVIVEPDSRAALRKYLIDRQIYCPIHWPVSDIHTIMPGAKQLYESELSLICDQRYDAEDMSRLSETISSYLNKE